MLLANCNRSSCLARHNQQRTTSSHWRRPYLHGPATPRQVALRKRAQQRRLGHVLQAGNEYFGLLGPSFVNQARLTEGMVQDLMELPGTKGLSDLRVRAESLSAWKLSLQRGVLPDADVPWPTEPFKSKFLEAMSSLEMPRFTRRYPAVLDTLLKQMLYLVQEFETKLAEAEDQQQQKQQQRPQQRQQSTQRPENSQGEENESGEGDGNSGGGGDAMQEMTQEQMQQMMKEALETAAGQGESERELQVQLEDMEQSQSSQQEQGTDELDEKMAAELRQMTDDMIEQWKQQMAPVMQNLDKAQQAFDDLDGLMDSPDGFDLSKGTWQRDGWRELDELRKKLEGLRELRELVRSLGRGGGKGPLRRAPEEVETSKHPPGVIRSPLQPEQVWGLSRSGELSRMVPSEMALMAHGYRRSGGGDERKLQQGEDDGSVLMPEGSRGARLLHLVRRAERNLLSYERTGWLDDIPARVTGRMEIRPAAELGPIILCLDTSGSMRGARETVAKALALECMRGAHRQQRACYLYAFSGPGEVQELELGVDLKSLDKLLEFLSCSFMGGTDVDLPLALSLNKLEKEEWSQADILMVTDGEIQPPNPELLDRIQQSHQTLGLEVHGLLVSSQVTVPMQQLCTHLHLFKSWTAVGAESWQY